MTHFRCFVGPSRGGKPGSEQSQSGLQVGRNWYGTVFSPAIARLAASVSSPTRNAARGGRASVAGPTVDARGIAHGGDKARLETSARVDSIAQLITLI